MKPFSIPDVTGFSVADQHAAMMAWFDRDRAAANELIATLAGRDELPQMRASVLASAAGWERFLSRHAPKKPNDIIRLHHCGNCRRQWPCPDYADMAAGRLTGLGPDPADF